MRYTLYTSIHHMYGPPKYVYLRIYYTSKCLTTAYRTYEKREHLFQHTLAYSSLIKQISLKLLRFKRIGVKKKHKTPLT